jgi:membrane protein required for colicin V production
MNWVDIIIAVILVIGLARGFANGFVRGLFGLAALVLGIVIAAGNYEQVQDVMLSSLPVAGVMQSILAFMIVFVIVLLLVSIVGRLISKALKLASLGWLDRLAGAVLGVFMSCLFIAVLLLIVVMAGFEDTNGVARSKLSPHVIRVMDAVVAYAPGPARDVIDDHYLKLRVEWERESRRPPEEEQEAEPEEPEAEPEPEQTLEISQAGPSATGQRPLSGNAAGALSGDVRA